MKHREIALLLLLSILLGLVACGGQPNVGADPGARYTAGRRGKPEPDESHNVSKADGHKLLRRVQERQRTRQSRPSPGALWTAFRPQRRRAQGVDRAGAW